ncbi:MAG: YqeG family HAD IIIA-type phosphatase [Clostridiaceae bacterium]|nr:YqeG family HAD IIIA-type phosphatase [Clostridiaceae bacterium]
MKGGDYLILSKNLIPDRVVQKVSEFPFQEWKEKGYAFAFLDLDNTISKDRATEPDEYSFEVIRLIRTAGFQPCLVSNAKSSRSAAFATSLGIPFIDYAGKPSPKGVFRAIQIMNANKERCIMFGDQIFTDILAAKRAGIMAVLVEPYDKKEIFYVRLKRIPEWIIRNIYGF